MAFLLAAYIRQRPSIYKGLYRQFSTTTANVEMEITLSEPVTPNAKKRATEICERYPGLKP